MNFSSKRVLYILPQPFFLARGSSFRAYATIKAIAATGAEVDVLCYPIGNEIPKVPGVQIIRWRSFPRFKSVKIGPSLKKLILDVPLFVRSFYQARKVHYDAIHGVEEAGVMATIIGRLFGIPYIYDMHSWMSQQIEESGFVREGLLLSGFKRLEQFCLRGAKAVVTVGPSMTHILRSLAPGVPAFTLKDYSIDFSTDVCEQTKAALRQSYGLEGKKVFLYTGNFEEYQGIELLVYSFAKFLAAQGSPENYRLLLVGGCREQQQLVQRYSSLCRLLRISEQVVFAGERPVEEMGAYLSIADVFVSPRIKGNNVPLKVYTYLAMGKAIVATEIDSHTQVLHDGNAILCPATADEFALGLQRSVEAADQEHNLARMASARSAAEASKREFSEVIEACYSTAFANGREQPAYQWALALIPIEML